MKSNLKILLVEDEPIVGKEIENNLRNSGYEVVGNVSTAAAAIRKVQEEHPDLVIMDIALPGDMDGVAAAAEIRKKHDIPIIFQTAYSDASTLARAVEVEPFGYVLKPFTPQQLYTVIMISLARYKAEQRLKTDFRGYTDGVSKSGIPAPLLAICATCKRIREEADTWQTVEEYITRRMGTTLTHGICPQCAERLYPEIFGRGPGDDHA